MVADDPDHVADGFIGGVGDVDGFGYFFIHFAAESEWLLFRDVGREETVEVPDEHDVLFVSKLLNVEPIEEV